MFQQKIYRENGGNNREYYSTINSSYYGSGRSIESMVFKEKSERA